MNLTPRNPVLFVLVLAAAAALLFGGFLSDAPNRLVSGNALTLWHIAGTPSLFAIASLAAALFALSFAKPAKPAQRAALCIAALLLMLCCAAAGQAASDLMSGAPHAHRISLGGGFWVALFCLAMALLDGLQRLQAGPAMRLAIVAAVIAGLAAMNAAGLFDQLSLMREYTQQRSVFAAALLRHSLLVLGSVGAASAIGVPLGILVARKPRFGGPVFGTLNLLQTVPSIALFGLLIAPLSALANAFPALGTLGVGGIGAAPAVVALLLYALLPVVRNTEAGITGVEPSVIEAARAMGFSGTQIFWRVELPLGMPVFIAGLRIVLVQTIGLAAVAALIGAGGLGSFVFQGIGQYATDLVLLGAVPIILLALAADFILASLVAIYTGKPAP